MTLTISSALLNYQRRTGRSTTLSKESLIDAVKGKFDRHFVKDRNVIYAASVPDHPRLHARFNFVGEGYAKNGESLGGIII